MLKVILFIICIVVFLCLLLYILYQYILTKQYNNMIKVSKNKITRKEFEEKLIALLDTYRSKYNIKFRSFSDMNEIFKIHDEITVTTRDDMLDLWFMTADRLSINYQNYYFTKFKDFVYYKNFLANLINNID